MLSSNVLCPLLCILESLGKYERCSERNPLRGFCSSCLMEMHSCSPEVALCTEPIVSATADPSLLGIKGVIVSLQWDTPWKRQPFCLGTERAIGCIFQKCHSGCWVGTRFIGRTLRSLLPYFRHKITVPKWVVILVMERSGKIWEIFSTCDRLETQSYKRAKAQIIYQSLDWKPITSDEVQ